MRFNNMLTPFIFKAPTKKMSKRDPQSRDYIENVIGSVGIDQLKMLKRVIDDLISQKKENETITQAKLEKVKKVIEQTGLSSSELVEILEGKPRRKYKRPVKYMFPDEHGNPKGWAGVGKRPKQLQKLLDEGNDLESYRIHSEE